MADAVNEPPQAAGVVPPPGLDAPVPPGGLSSGGSYGMQVQSGLPPAGLSIIGLLTALLGAWAGVSVFVGPSFGWSPDGSPSWQWSLIHAALHAAPGGVALIAGMVMVAMVPKAARGAGRSGSALAGLLAILAGAWLVVGPSEWPVLESTHQDRVRARRTGAQLHLRRRRQSGTGLSTRGYWYIRPRLGGPRR